MSTPVQGRGGRRPSTQNRFSKINLGGPTPLCELGKPFSKSQGAHPCAQRAGSALQAARAWLLDKGFPNSHKRFVPFEVYFWKPIQGFLFCVTESFRVFRLDFAIADQSVSLREDGFHFWIFGVVI